MTTNTTLFDGADPNSVRRFFDEMTELGVEGMMLSPGYSYDKAPDQQHFLGRARTRRLFRAILRNRKSTWNFNMSPLFGEFLMGKRNFSCTPWGMPTYNVFGWQKPCYLLQDGYADSFAELMAETAWAQYGTESGNPKCANCMVHSGYEASAVDYAFSSLRRIFRHGEGVCFQAAIRIAEALDTAGRAAEAGAFLQSAGANRMSGTPVESGSPRSRRRALSMSICRAWFHRSQTKKICETALEKAFEYRGDVTITCKDGSVIEGYVYDRRAAATLGDSRGAGAAGERRGRE